MTEGTPDRASDPAPLSTDGGAGEQTPPPTPPSMVPPTVAPAPPGSTAGQPIAVPGTVTSPGTPAWPSTSGPGGTPPPGWVPAPAPAPRSNRRRNLLLAAGVVVALLVIGAATGSINFTVSVGRQPGTIVFGTTAGTDLCSVGEESDTIKAGTPVYFGARLLHKLAGTETIHLTITRDGKPVFQHDETGQGEDFDCYGSQKALGTLDPGTYVFTITHNADTEATGTLKVS